MTAFNRMINSYPKKETTQKTILLIVVCNNIVTGLTQKTIFKPPSKPDLRSVDHTRVCKLIWERIWLITIKLIYYPTDLLICLLLLVLKRESHISRLLDRLLVRVQQITSSPKDQTTVCLGNLHCFVILPCSYRTIFQTRFITDFHHFSHMRQQKRALNLLGEIKWKNY